MSMYRSSSPTTKIPKTSTGSACPVSIFCALVSANCRRFSAPPPASTFVDLLIRFLGYCSPLTASRYTRQNVYCGKWAAFWIKYFDIVIAHHSVADIMWGSPYFFGRKPLSSEQLSTDGKYQL